MAVTPTVLNVKNNSEARLSNVEVTGNLEVTGTTTQTGATTFTALLTASGGVKLPGQVITGDGAITIKSGVVVLTKAGAGAITLAAPTAVTDDYKILYVVAGSAQAHVLTITGAAGGAGQDVGTFGGAINDGCCLCAYNATWLILGAPRNVTFA